MNFFKKYFCTIGLMLLAQTGFCVVDFNSGNEVVAVVGSRAITADELRVAISPMLRSIREQSKSESDFNDKVEQAGREVLQNLIDRLIVLEDAQKKNMRVPDSYIEAEYDSYVKNNFNGDRVKFLEYLRSQGMTSRDFKEQLQEKMLFGYIRNQVQRSRSEVSPEKVLEYYRTHESEFMNESGYKIRQVIMKPGAGESLEALRKKAQDIKTRADAGENFFELAKLLNPKEREELNWQKIEDYRKEFADELAKMKKGDTTNPIELGGMIVILHIDDYREAGIRPLKEVSGEIEQILLNQYAREAERDWLDRLRKTVYYKILI